MTLQQEIVEALRDAANMAIVQDDKEHFFNLSASVDNARCETCKKYFMATSEDMEGVPCPWAGSGGCWNYEQKEKASK